MIHSKISTILSIIPSFLNLQQFILNKVRFHPNEIISQDNYTFSQPPAGSFFLQPHSKVCKRICPQLQHL
jgi:hypothetical protein